MCAKDTNNMNRELFEAFRNLKHVSRFWRPPIGESTPSEVMMLFVMRHSMEEHQRGLKASELSGKLRVSSPTVTQMLNIMEARGLIEREPDREDRRVVRVRPTEAGMKVTTLAMESVHREMELLINHLGVERSLQLTELLNDVFQFYKGRGMDPGQSEKEGL